VGSHAGVTVLSEEDQGGDLWAEPELPASGGSESLQSEDGEVARGIYTLNSYLLFA
jgi:hypothetical protein